jgi:RimJ/RimL family protein N-acetyltransferase
MIPTLETDRLRLRPWRAHDFEPMAAFYADDRTGRYIGRRISREQAWRHLVVIVSHWFLCALKKRARAGLPAIAAFGIQRDFPRSEVGWGLTYDGQWHGYATEAAARAQSYAYNIEMTRLVSYIAPRNERSIRVAERLGVAPAGSIQLCGQEAIIYRHPSPGN